MVDDRDRMTVDDRDVVGDQGLGRRRVGHDPPVVQHDDALGVSSSQVQLVEHDDDGAAGVRQLAGDREHQVLMAEVERRGRLVEQDHRRLLGEDAGHVDERLLAARTGGKRALAQVGGPHTIDGLGHYAVVAAAVVPGEATHLDDGAGIEREHRLRVLREHAAGPGQLERLHRADRSAVDGDRTGAGGEVAGEHGQPRRLAGAVRTDERGDFAKVQGDRHASTIVFEPIRTLTFCAHTDAPALAPTRAPTTGETATALMRIRRTRAGCAE